MGLQSIPETLLMFFTPPPYAFQFVALIDYTIKLVLAFTLEVLPLASIVAVPFALFGKRSVESHHLLRATAHFQWIKSAVMLVALAAAQLYFGNPYLTGYLISLDTFLLVVISPLIALASLGLLSAKSRKGGASDED